MAISENEDLPFGTFTPQGLGKLLIEASRNTIIGHAETRRLVWRIVRALPQQAFDVVVNGARVRLHPRDSSLERVLLLRPQKYCPGEISFLRRALEAGGTVVDAGANIGVFSLSLASMRGVTVVAVEPNPVALGRLRFNISASGFSNISVDPVALSGADGSVRFFAHRDNIGLSGIGEAWADGVEAEVPAKALATVLADANVRAPFALKIDVERHEDVVLMPFFRDVSPAQWPSHILIETIGHQGIPECVSFMLANGYEKTFESRQNTGLSYKPRGSA